MIMLIPHFPEPVVTGTPEICKRAAVDKQRERFPGNIMNHFGTAFSIVALDAGGIRGTNRNGKGLRKKCYLN